MTFAAALPTAPAQGTVARDRVGVDLLCAGALTLLAISVCAGALANDFVLDDRGVVLGNPLVQNLPQSWRAFAQPYWPDAVGGGQYRPLGIVHFALDWGVSGGSPTWFHAVSLAWHALATLLVWSLARRLMALWPAVVAAALFAVHPVHVEAVANVVGRLELMAAVFALGTVLAHRAGSWFAVPLFALGLLSKENAIVALGLVLVADILRPTTSDLRPRKALYIGYVVVLVAYAATLLFIFRERPFSTTTGTLADASLATRLWTMATVVPHYLRLLVFPAALSADYEPQVISAANGLTATAAVGLLMLTTYLGSLALAWRRNKHLALALLWVGIALAPVSNIFFVSGVTLAERALYLPSVGAVLALGMAYQWGARRWRPVAATAVVALVIAGSWRTWTRTPAWRDDRAYLMTLLSDHPESYRGHWVAGRVYAATGQLADAQHELSLARQLFPRAPNVYLDAAAVAQRLNDTVQATALRDSAATIRARGQR